VLSISLLLSFAVLILYPQFSSIILG